MLWGRLGLKAPILHGTHHGHQDHRVAAVTARVDRLAVEGRDVMLARGQIDQKSRDSVTSLWERGGVRQVRVGSSGGGAFRGSSRGGGRRG